jgi:hypothetical protein
VAFPVTFGFFANWFAFWFGGLAVGDAVWLFAYGDTFRAVEKFATFVRAFNFTFRFLTLYITYGILGFCTTGVAFRRFTDWVTNSRAMWIITFPGALGMTFCFSHEASTLGKN